jgi:hypothetical protein
MLQLEDGPLVTGAACGKHLHPAGTFCCHCSRKREAPVTAAATRHVPRPLLPSCSRSLLLTGSGASAGRSSSTSWYTTTLRGASMGLPWWHSSSGCQVTVLSRRATCMQARVMTVSLQG